MKKLRSLCSSFLYWFCAHIDTSLGGIAECFGLLPDGGNLIHEYCMRVLSLVLQSCPTLCDPMNSSPPDSSVHGILQARILEWVAISFSNYMYCIGQKVLSTFSIIVYRNPPNELFGQPSSYFCINKRDRAATFLDKYVMKLTELNFHPL